MTNVDRFGVPLAVGHAKLHEILTFESRFLPVGQGIMVDFVDLFLSDFGFPKFPNEISDFVPANRIYSLRAETMVDGLRRAFKFLGAWVASLEIEF